MFSTLTALIMDIGFKNGEVHGTTKAHLLVGHQKIDHIGTAVHSDDFRNCISVEIAQSDARIFDAFEIRIISENALVGQPFHPWPNKDQAVLRRQENFISPPDSNHVRSSSVYIVHVKLAGKSEDPLFILFQQLDPTSILM